jgi:linoleate 8R-lipoxygenase / 9,12-octadecadienoate 8-hydroperoxide 8R-isomerase
VDPAIFPDPHKVVLDRNLDLYIHHRLGPQQYLGSGLSQVAMTAMLKTVGQLDNLRRTSGAQGEIKRIVGPHGLMRYMTVDQSNYSPFPTCMKIQWDGALPSIIRPG